MCICITMSNLNLPNLSITYSARIITNYNPHVMIHHHDHYIRPSINKYYNDESNMNRLNLQFKKNNATHACTYKWYEDAININNIYHLWQYIIFIQSNDYQDQNMYCIIIHAFQKCIAKATIEREYCNLCLLHLHFQPCCVKIQRYT